MSNVTIRNDSTKGCSKYRLNRTGKGRAHCCTATGRSLGQESEPDMLILWYEIVKPMCQKSKNRFEKVLII